MIALPGPQNSTTPLVLSARFVAPLGPGSLFDFSVVAPQPLVNVSSGILYRILSYSFATEIPEDVYSASLVTANPVSFQLRNTGNDTDILAKSIPVPIYQRDAGYLQYFEVFTEETEILATMSGQLNANNPDLIGYASVAAVLSLFVQAISDDDWIQAFHAGGM
jgi:hypothetical protein